MDTFTRSLVDAGFARMVASVLLDSTQGCEACTGYDLAEKIGFLDSVDSAVEQSLKDRPTIKSTGKDRDPNVVREGIVLERTSLLSTLVGLGAFDGLVSDGNGNPVSFTSRIGIHGGFARVGDIAPKTEKKEGEKKGKNPDAWKRVPTAFVERMERLLEKLTADGKSVTSDNLVIAIMEDAGREPKEFLKSGDYSRWQSWATDTREGNPKFKDAQNRPLYKTKQGRVGGLERASYPAETVKVETVEVSTVETVSAQTVEETASTNSADQAEFVEVASSTTTES